ncbi:MAG: hypothetical protein LBP87_06710 [Planctomycetaceae bacterium]|jgi:hypothetical protein|nr:hypothetical protein [Planctomycetaceae bacterium]
MEDKAKGELDYHDTVMLNKMRVLDLFNVLKTAIRDGIRDVLSPMQFKMKPMSDKTLTFVFRWVPSQELPETRMNCFCGSHCIGMVTFYSGQNMAEAILFLHAELSEKDSRYHGYTHKHFDTMENAQSWVVDAATNFFNDFEFNIGEVISDSVLPDLVLSDSDIVVAKSEALSELPDTDSETFAKHLENEISYYRYVCIDDYIRQVVPVILEKELVRQIPCSVCGLGCSLHQS